MQPTKDPFATCSQRIICACLPPICFNQGMTQSGCMNYVCSMIVASTDGAFFVSTASGFKGAGCPKVQQSVFDTMHGLIVGFVFCWCFALRGYGGNTQDYGGNTRPTSARRSQGLCLFCSICLPSIRAGISITVQTSGHRFIALGNHDAVGYVVAGTDSAIARLLMHKYLPFSACGLFLLVLCMGGIVAACPVSIFITFSSVCERIEAASSLMAKMPVGFAWWEQGAWFSL